jgi:hypothetical protein
MKVLNKYSEYKVRVMKKKKIIIIVLFVLLIALNALLIYANINRHLYIESLTETLSMLSLNPAEDEGHLELPLDELNFKKDKLNLIVVFSDYGCESCIYDYSLLLNKIYERNKDFISVYYTGSQNDFFGKYKLKIPYKKIPLALFERNKIKIAQPYAILYDKNWHMIISNVAKKDQPTAAEKYFDKVDYLLSLIKK